MPLALSLTDFPGGCAVITVTELPKCHRTNILTSQHGSCWSQKRKVGMVESVDKCSDQFSTESYVFLVCGESFFVPAKDCSRGLFFMQSPHAIPFFIRWLTPEMVEPGNE
jgi:hypothetical protein